MFPVPRLNISELYGAEIDRSNPLTIGLQHLYLPGVRRGVDLCGKFELDRKPNEIWDISQAGPCSRNTTNNCGFFGTLPAETKVTELSYFWLGSFFFSADTTPDGALIGISYANTNVGPFWCQSLQRNSNTTIRLLYNSDGATKVGSSVSITTGPSGGGDGPVYAIGATFHRTLGNTLYLNGEIALSEAWSGTSDVSFSATSQLTLGDYGGLFNSHTTAATVMAAIWTRQLTTEEHSQISRDPFALVRPSCRIYKAPAAAAAVGSGLTTGLKLERRRLVA